MVARTSSLLAPLALLVACTAPSKAPSTDSGATDTSTEISPPCAGGTWGAIDEALVGTGYHVSATADAGGDGSAGSPFATIEDALSASRAEGGARAILIGPGAYAASLDLSTDQGDDGLRIHGCGAGEVEIDVPEDQPGVKVSGVQDLDLRGFSVVGGTRGLWIWQGAVVTATDIHAASNVRLGVIVDGASTTVSFTDLVVSDPVRDTDFGGFGIAVQGAQVTFAGVTVEGATEAGVLVDGSDANVDVSTITVTGTASNPDGALGRGIQVQNLASLSVTDAALSDNHDAGIFGLGALSITLVRVDVSATVGTPVEGWDDTSGDGIVVTDGDPSSSWADLYFSASLQDVSTASVDRAGILLAGNGLGVALSGSVTGVGAISADGLPLTQDGVTVTGGAVTAVTDVLGFSAASMGLDTLSP